MIFANPFLQSYDHQFEKVGIREAMDLIDKSLGGMNGNLNNPIKKSYLKAEQLAAFNAI
jgi:hypothetical protein